MGRLKLGGRRRRLLKTGQTTCYLIGDDGDFEVGGEKSYIVHTTGDHSGTVNLDVPHYAGDGLAFVNSTSKITDSANGLATFLTGDTIVVRGSGDNDGTYTIATGGVAGEIVVSEALTDEAAGAVISICKRTSHSNNAVLDQQTGLTWARYTSSGEKVGEASDGKLDWYDAAGSCFTLHAAAADLQMIAGTAPILRIVGGAGEVAVYNVGDVIVCSGFADADNNLPGWTLQSVTVNGADLDLVLGPTDSNLLADISSEAAGGSRDIKLVCRSIFSYCAAANAANAGAGLANLTDWRIPNLFELICLRNMTPGDAAPDTTAFPDWPTVTEKTWAATTSVEDSANATRCVFSHGGSYFSVKTDGGYTALVRGGV